MVEVAPTTAEKEVAPGASLSHWTVGGGLPSAAAAKVTGWPAITDWLVGAAVTVGADGAAAPLMVTTPVGSSATSLVGVQRTQGHRELPVGLDGGTRRDGHRHGGGGHTGAQGDRAVHDGRVVTVRPPPRSSSAVLTVQVMVSVWGLAVTGTCGGLGVGGVLDHLGRPHVDELVGQIGGPEQVGPPVVVLDDHPVRGRSVCRPK